MKIISVGILIILLLINPIPVFADYDANYQWIKRSNLEWIEEKAFIPNDHIFAISTNGEIIVTFTETGDIYRSTDSITWVNVTPKDQEYIKIKSRDLYFRNVIWANNEFKIFGGEQVLSSYDGAIWKTDKYLSKEINNFVPHFAKIIFSGNKYLAASDHDYFCMSDDGINWSFCDLPVDNRIYSLSSNGKNIILVGEQGLILKSEDGIMWEVIHNKVSEDLKDITWDGRRYIAVGNSGTIIYSDDGSIWHEKTNARLDLYFGIEPDRIHFNNIKSYDGRIIAVGLNGAATSIDALNYDYYFYFSNLQCVDSIKYKDQYLAIDQDGSVLRANQPIEKQALSQRISWSKLDPVTKYRLSDITWNGKIYVSSGGYINYPDHNQEILTSNDGIIWSSTGNSKEHYTPSIKWLSKYFIGYGNRGWIYFSADGQKWRKVNTKTENIWDVTSNGKTYVLVGGGYNVNNRVDKYSSNILTSSDTINWSNNSFTLPGVLKSVIWDGKRFIAVGGEFDNGKNDNNSRSVAAISNDGKKWSKISIPSKQQLTKIIWTGKKYAAIGDKGGIYTSSDLANWNTFECNPSEQYNTGVNDIIWNGSKFVAICFNGKIFSSIDGVQWSGVFQGNSYLEKIIWNGKLFLAVGGYPGSILISYDGENWVEDLTVNDYLHSVLWNGREFIIVGNNGVILKGEETKKK